MSSVQRPSSRPSGRSLRISTALLAGALALGSVACGDDDGDDGANDNPDGGGSQPGFDAGGMDATTNNPGDGSVVDTGAAPEAVPPDPTSATAGQYVLATAVSVGMESTTYVKTIADPNTAGKINFADTLEAGGFGDIAYLGGKLYVYDRDKPTVTTKFNISTDGKVFTPEKTVDFATYTTAAALYNMAFVSPTKALLWTENQYVVWNPTTMLIEGTIPLPKDKVGVRETIKPFYGYDRAFVARGNRVYHLVSYIDYVNYDQTASSSVVVINTDNNAIVDVLEAPCPSLDNADVDPKGDIYLSGWTFGPGATLIKGDAKGCIVKIPAGSDSIDPSFKLVPSEITGGHEAAAFRHFYGSKYLMTVFDEKKVTFDPKDAAGIGGWLQKDSWFFAIYDIATRKYQRVDALGNTSGGYYSTKIGDRFYVLNPGAGFASTTYQQLFPKLTVTTGTTMDGWSTRLVRIN